MFFPLGKYPPPLFTAVPFAHAPRASLCPWTTAAMDSTDNGSLVGDVGSGPSVAGAAEGLGSGRGVVVVVVGGG